jgi:hypothetical protein
MMPRNYYQLQQMKTQNMKREYLGNITQRKKANLNQVIKDLKASVSKYATVVLVLKKKGQKPILSK